jgi:hypothetical protein
VRLLLDEHYSPEIAEQLRAAHGHDVIHAAEVTEIKGRHDAVLLTWAVQNGRAIVTENVADFMPLHQEMIARGEHHHGLIFTNPRQLPRSKHTIGLFVRSLNGYLRTLPEGFTLADTINWLLPIQT